jgi:bromodomain-containing protein 7/9
LSSSAKLEDEKSVNPDDDKLPALVSAALHVRPRAAATLAALLQIHSHKIDMAALIRTPAELEQSEEEWAGKGFAANGPTEMNVVLDYVADVICGLQAERDGFVKLEPDVAVDEGTGESTVVRNLRLNLLALVKRAPLDTIARLPVDLVPEHIRQYVPTLTTVAGGPQS